MSSKSPSFGDLRSTNTGAIQEEETAKIDYDVAYLPDDKHHSAALQENTSDILKPDHSFRKGWMWTVVNHIKKHTGVGIVCAVAYFDP